jgi:hypothetical protein
MLTKSVNFANFVNSVKKGEILSEKEECRRMPPDFWLL